MRITAPIGLAHAAVAVVTGHGFTNLKVTTDDTTAQIEVPSVFAAEVPSLVAALVDAGATVE